MWSTLETVSGSGSEAEASWPLIGRERELALLDEQVGEAAGAVVLAGPPGVGKSRLMAAWLSRLAARGQPAVVVRSTRSTATIPFGAFARWVPESVVHRSDRLGVLRATAASFARRRRLVLAVDDAQLLDAGSAALVFDLAQQGTARMVLTVRAGDPCPDAVVALWKEGLARRLDVAPLSKARTAELVERALGGPVARAAQRRLWQLTAGTPLWVREVVDAARSQGVLVHGGGVWRWQGALAGRALPVGLVGDRVAVDDPAERRLLELVALAEPLRVDVATRLVPVDVVAGAERRGLVAVESRSPDGPAHLRMAHPLYSEVLRAQLPTFTVAAHYRALAEAAVAAGAHRSDRLRVATWLLESGDDGAPELLLEASALAAFFDEHTLSARLAGAAERAGGGWRATVRRAEALGRLRRWREADALLDALSAPGREPEARAAAARVRANQAFWYRREDLTTARAALVQAAESAPGSDRSPLLAARAQLALFASDLDESIRLATAAFTEGETPAARLDAIATAGLAAVLLGRTGAALAAVALAAPYALEVLDADPIPLGYVAHAYSLAAVLDGRLVEATLHFEALMEAAESRDSLPRAMPAFWLARVHLASGGVRTAARLCREAFELLEDALYLERGVWVAATLATAAAQSGDIETAERALAWADSDTPDRSTPSQRFLDMARAWLAAARGELSAARDLAWRAARDARRHGAWAIELAALVEVTRFAAPAAAAPRLEELTRLVEGPYAVAAARFARAAAAGDGAGLDEVAERFADLGAHLLAAEAAATAAAAHTTDGNGQRRAASLGAAWDLAARCEGAATPLLARLAEQPTVATLTAREHEIAELAARGRSGPEIADMLAISVRTVHSHLNHAYAKLGIGGRRELAALLGGERGSQRQTR